MPRNPKRSFREYDRKRHKARRSLIASYKDVPCADCGVKYPPYVMDFDHRGDKVQGVAGMWSRSMEVLLAEIAKCDVVCANCHRERTHG